MAAKGSGAADPGQPPSSADIAFEARLVGLHEEMAAKTAQIAQEVAVFEKLHQTALDALGDEMLAEIEQDPVWAQPLVEAFQVTLPCDHDI
jgi:hypothetical protein